MEDFEFDYDAEHDSLFLFKKGGKSKGSVELGNLIFDFDYRLRFVGLQILNAATFIEEISGEKNIKELLISMKKCTVKHTTHKNLLVILINLISAKKLQIPLTVPNIKYKSPALVYA